MVANFPNMFRYTVTPPKILPKRYSVLLRVVLSGLIGPTSSEFTPVDVYSKLNTSRLFPDHTTLEQTELGSPHVSQPTPRSLFLPFYSGYGNLASTSAGHP